MVCDARLPSPLLQLSSRSAISSGQADCMKEQQEEEEEGGSNSFDAGASSWLVSKLATGAPVWPFPLLESSSSSSLSPSSSSLSSSSSPWSSSSCLCNSPPYWEGQDSAALANIQTSEDVTDLLEETDEDEETPSRDFSRVSRPISIACYQSWRNQLSTNPSRSQSQSVFQLDEEEDIDIVQSIFSAVPQHFPNPSENIQDGSLESQRFVKARQHLEVGGMESRGPIFLATSPVSWESSFDSSTLTLNFLGACFFCHSLLSQGKDIYMYRGDCAFCSLECRYQQIALDDLDGRLCQQHIASMVSLDAKAKPWHRLQPH